MGYNSDNTTSKACKQQTLRCIETNLYRADTTGIYYAILVVNGKQYTAQGKRITG